MMPWKELKLRIVCWLIGHEWTGWITSFPPTGRLKCVGGLCGRCKFRWGAMK